MHCNDFGSNLDNQGLIDELDQRILGLGDFSWEVGPGIDHDDNFALVISPSGCQEMLLETRAIISTAPACHGWEFYPARPRKKWKQSFVVSDDCGHEYSVDASLARYVLRPAHEGRFRIVLSDDSVCELPPELQDIAADILIEGELGEELRMMAIDLVCIVSGNSADMKSLGKPIQSLYADLNSMLGRTDRCKVNPPGTKYTETDH